MSCHTWSYHKLSVSDEVKKQMQEKFEKKYEQIFSLKDEELFNIWKQEMRERYPKVPAEVIEPQFSFPDYAEGLKETRKELKNENTIEKIRHGDFTNAELLIDFNDFIEHKDKLILFYNGNFYIEDDDIAFDMFRVNYAEKIFTDAESLITWLKTQKYVGYYKEHKNIGFCDELCERIQKTFNDNPDILIEFG